MSLIEQAKRFLAGRRHAYRMVFHRDNNYTEDVLRDLAKFCRAHNSTGHADANVAARLDGRREVWLRIQNHLQLTEDELWMLHGEK